MADSPAGQTPSEVADEADSRAAKGRTVEAIAILMRALQDYPDSAILHVRLGSLMTAGDRTSEALSHLARGLELDEDAFDAYDKMGTYLQRLGRFEEAVGAFERAVERDPKSPNGYFGWVRSKKIEPSDLPVIRQFVEALRCNRWSEIEREMSHFGLGKAFDDLGEYKRAMWHFDQANHIANNRRVRSGYWFDPSTYCRAVDMLIDTFNAEFMRRNCDVGLSSELPVLIVGMMRSGTTLVEQVLSAHPKVAAGGELPYWREHPKAQTLGLGIARGSLPMSAGVEVAEGYRLILRTIGPHMLRVTDKNVFNYFSIGLVHLLFPNAHFINCRRNPLDNCLSMYVTPCGDGGLLFLHVKQNLVFAYREYERLMEHWRTVLPPDKLIDVSYEELILSPEAEIRRIISSVGLEWDDACLHPESSERVVHTPSRWQVRQPIYNSSVDRWRNYEPWLGEFRSLMPGQPTSFDPSHQLEPASGDRHFGPSGLF